MNRIISININGVVFNVDEVAYESLRSYLESLHRHFRNTEGKDEIMADIEARIAEMLQQELKKGDKEVVTTADVESIIAAMGHPEDFSEGETTGNEQQQGQTAGSQGYQNYEPRNGPRRLYRNPDERVLGGVCSGMASYFNTDPIWIRLIFLVVFFGFGSGLLVYIILWIVIPPARTAAEKLEMRGYDVNISNIEKSVRGEMDDIKGKWNDVKGEARDFYNDRRGRASNFAGEFFGVVGKIIGAFFLFIGIMTLVGLFIGLLALIGVVGANFPFVPIDVLGNSNNMWMGMIGILLAFGIPLLVLIYLGIRLLFNRRLNNHWVGPALFVAWIVGIGMISIAGMNSAKRFSNGVTLTETDSLPMNDTLYIGLKPSEGRYMVHEHNTRGRVVVIDDENELSRVQFNIEKSVDNQFHLLQIKKARGRNHDEAEQMASTIEYNYSIQNSELLLDEAFKLKEKGHWRAQDMKVILEVPAGKVVVMRKNMRRIIFDIDNAQNVYDDDMVERKWLMTENGLTCLDCPKDIIRDQHRYEYHREWNEDNGNGNGNTNDEDSDNHTGVRYQSSENYHLKKSYSIILM